jgi:hypothetical protein
LSTDSRPTAPVTLAALHEHFLAILPCTETHARVTFRALRCPGRRADAIAETVAVAWCWFVRLQVQGKNVDEFVSALASYAARHVRSGRRLVCSEKAKDVLSYAAQHRHGFRVQPLACSTRHSHETLYGEPHGQDQVDVLEEQLRDNTRSAVSEQAAFRIDYPVWLHRLASRQRAIVADMTLAHSTGELASKHQVSPARISQMRREFHEDWRRFHGEPVPGGRC